MKRYIDADLLQEDFKEDHGGKRSLMIDTQPTADVRENVRGEWLSKNLDNFRKYEVICSVCGARFIGNYDAYDEPYDFNFCPNCGADMRGDK
jgi:hypothetical protein